LTTTRTIAEIRLPFNNLAADEESSALPHRVEVCGNELRGLPHDSSGRRSFDHATTGFALTGTHLSADADALRLLHVNNNYTLSRGLLWVPKRAFPTPRPLAGTYPNHVTAGFPITASSCATCHAITTWAAGVFDHSAPAPADQCARQRGLQFVHINNNYAANHHATDVEFGCHLTAWQQTTNPVHPTPEHICSGELFHLPHDGELDHGNFLITAHRVCLNGTTCHRRRRLRFSM